MELRVRQRTNVLPGNLSGFTVNGSAVSRRNTNRPRGTNLSGVQKKRGVEESYGKENVEQFGAPQRWILEPARKERKNCSVKGWTKAKASSERFKEKRIALRSPKQGTAKGDFEKPNTKGAEQEKRDRNERGTEGVEEEEGRPLAGGPHRCGARRGQSAAA